MKNRLMKVFRNEEKHCYNCSKINRAIQQPGVATAKALVDNVAKDMIARKTACSFYSFSDREVAKSSSRGLSWCQGTFSFLTKEYFMPCEISRRITENR